MKGYVNVISNKSYGFIYDDLGKHYFFHKSSLLNCTLFQLEEGDAVEFDEAPGKDGKLAAINVRKIYQARSEQIETHPGINPLVILDHFNDDEQKIIHFFARVFYVTSGGGEIRIGQSVYRYFLIKPTVFFNRMFQLNRELVVIFSDYVSFEPRSLDAAAYVYTRIESQLRLDRGCHVFISHDDLVEEKMTNLLKDGSVNQIVVPFTYRELISDKADDDLVKNRFRKYLFDNDLFSVSAPIQNDVFFFGRRDYVHDIVSKCKNNTNCGVFGLRRSGKTSVLYATRNLLEQQGYPTVFIPCESDLSSLNWKSALRKIVLDVYQVFKKDPCLVTEDKYDGPNTVIFFEQQLFDCLKGINVPTTLMFDEIEAITFSVPKGESSENLWLDGDNFVQFWNAIKGYYSKHPNQINILVAGTNPMINEVPTVGINGLSNPMFRQLSESNQGAYLPPFSVEDTKNMVNTLGSYMGLSFDDYSIGALTSDCGGHPYLMRILCSQINRYLKNETSISRPFVITKAVYDKAFVEFEKSAEASSFFLMVLNILMTSYPKEFNILKYLAFGDDKIVSETQDKESLLHLLGYGLVDSSAVGYAIKYNTISIFLQGKYQFERQGLSVEEQNQEIQVRLNRAEGKLRKIVKNQLISTYGMAKAKEIVIKAMAMNKAISQNDLLKAEGMNIAELFDPSINKVYLSLLEMIIKNNYGAFSMVFESVTLPQLETKLDEINVARRCPSHSYDDSSSNWSWSDFLAFRQDMTWLEKVLEKFD